MFLGHQLVLFLASFLGWLLQAGDVSSAFLQGNQLERELYLRLPRDMPPRVANWCRQKLGTKCRGDVVRARKGVFGLGESPRLWYLRSGPSCSRWASSRFGS